jgi:hypothetical protein
MGQAGLGEEMKREEAKTYLYLCIVDGWARMGMRRQNAYKLDLSSASVSDARAESGPRTDERERERLRERERERRERD